MIEKRILQARAKAYRNKMKRAGYCINGRSHGRVKKGTKCKRCVEIHHGKVEGLRTRRQKARANGLCGTCSSRKPEGKKATCEPCLEIHRTSKQRAIAAANWCVKCAGAGFHRADCPTRGRVYWTLLGARR